MSGHSKWAGIKHKKAIIDAKKGKEFTKVANMITIAAKEGGNDPKMNFSLRLAIDKAKAVNMPATNVERAIKRGMGELGGVAPEELIYEGYGSAGVAVLLEVMTDNRNRTASEVRSIFSKHGGNMADAGAVAYIFEEKGRISISLDQQKIDREALELAIVESGADDYEQDGNDFIIYTKKINLQNVLENLEENSIIVSDSEITYIPKNEITISDAEIAKKIIKLVDALEEIEDVTAVHANFDISEEILEKI
ncbi:MAG: YebC/PmpR family DNA-binding transcriptional regulator [bacterium]